MRAAVYDHRRCPARHRHTGDAGVVTSVLSCAPTRPTSLPTLGGSRVSAKIRSSRYAGWVLTALKASSVVLGGCGVADTASETRDRVGAAGLALTLPGNVVLDSASYTITGSGGFTKTGTLDVSSRPSSREHRRHRRRSRLRHHHHRDRHGRHDDLRRFCELRRHRRSDHSGCRFRRLA